MTDFKCVKCDKKFVSQNALDDHNNSKHYVEKKVKSNNLKIYFLIFLVILIIVGYLYYTPGVDAESGKYDLFAQCVNNSGAKMYGAYWCSHCKTQKESFGDSFSFINYVECSLPNNAGQNEICKEAGVDSYPTWEFGDGLRINGFVTLEKLAERTGCELPK